jgi:NAD(P)-dependent dehydrogenase (short-subunit alcohol dehydrogenase family)
MDSSTKTIVITGGAKGIGREVAWSYRQRGYNVVIGDILDQLGQKVVDDMNQKQVARPSILFFSQSLILFSWFDRAEKKVAVYKHTDVSYYQDNVTLFKTASAEFGKIDVKPLTFA